jgi:hypothetical protein
VARRGEAGASLGKKQEECLSWIEEEKGEFQQDFFPPVHIPTVLHTPWVYKNIPILPGLQDELVKIICDKIVSGAYEPSNAAHHSRWFCVIKQDGCSLCIVHNLCPFNAITIGDASIPPIMEQTAELLEPMPAMPALTYLLPMTSKLSIQNYGTL